MWWDVPANSKLVALDVSKFVALVKVIQKDSISIIFITSSVGESFRVCTLTVIIIINIVR